MALDWDMLVLKPAEAIFGASVSYQRPGEPSFSLADAVFDRHHELITFGDGAPVSTRVPMLSIRASAFPSGFTPAQGDTVSAEGGLYVVTDVQPDGKGGIKLPLSSREDEGP